MDKKFNTPKTFNKRQKWCGQLLYSSGIDVEQNLKDAVEDYNKSRY